MQQEQVGAIVTTRQTVTPMDDYMIGQQQHLLVHLDGTCQAMQNLLP